MQQFSPHINKETNENNKKKWESDIGITRSTREEVPPHNALKNRRLPGALRIPNQTQINKQTLVRAKLKTSWSLVPDRRRRRRRGEPPRGNRRRRRSPRGRCTPSGSDSPTRSSSPSSPLPKMKERLTFSLPKMARRISIECDRIERRRRRMWFELDRMGRRC